MSRSIYLQRVLVGVFCHALMFAQHSFAAPGDIINTFSTGGPVYASPTLSPNGVLYIGANDSKCYAIESLDGVLTEKWVYTADEWIDSSAAVGPDGTLYIATYGSTLVALDPNTGAEKWAVTVGEDDSALGVIRSSPAIAEDGTIILTTNAGFVHAFDPTGDQQWSFEFGSESRSSPAIDVNGNVYFGADDGKLYCLSRFGELQWSYAVDGAGTDASRINSSPTIDGDGNLYIGSGNGFLYSVSASGSLRWKYETTEAVDCSPVIDANDRVYFGSRAGSVFCVNQSGSLEWSTFLGDIFYSSPVIDANGFVYATYFGGQGRTFVVALGPGGAEVWQTQINAIIDSSLTVALDGVLYVGAFDGNVYAIEGSGSSLDYDSNWPRFRKDNRSRGRIIDGSLPRIITPPVAAVVTEGMTAEFFTETAEAHSNHYFWRKNGNLIEENDQASLRLTRATDDTIAVYDVIVSNDFGEILSPLTYLSIYTQPTYEIIGGMFKFSTNFTYPISTGLGDVQVTHSSDLLNWSGEGILVEILESGSGGTDIKASISTATPQGFFRLESGIK